MVRTQSQGAGLRPTIQRFHHSHRQIPPQTACCPVAQVKAETSLCYWSVKKEVSVLNMYRVLPGLSDIFQCIAPNHKSHLKVLDIGKQFQRLLKMMAFNV